MIFNSNHLLNFFNFFLLLFFLNSFLLIDPELIIFFSISLVIILFTNNLSEIILKFFSINFINYYYNYIKFFNIQLYNLYEYTKFLNLNLFFYNFPFYLDYFNNFIYFINNFYFLNFKQWVNLIEYNYSKLLKRVKIRLFKFYFNYYFLIIDQIFYLFPRLELNDGELLLDYFYANNKYSKSKLKGFKKINKFNNFPKKINFFKNKFSNDDAKIIEILKQLCLASFRYLDNIETIDFRKFHQRFNKFFTNYNLKFSIADLFNTFMKAKKMEQEELKKKSKKGFFSNFMDRLVKSLF